MTLDLTKPIQTREGRSVRIFATDFKNADRPLLGAIDYDGSETPYTWYRDGSFSKIGVGHPFDLRNVPEEQKGWINIFHGTPELAHIYPTREAADLVASRLGIPRFACLELAYERGTGL